MRFLTKLISFLLIAVGLSGMPANAQAERLKVSLTPVSAIVQGDADILVRVTMTNPTAKPITIPIWQVPSDDIPTPILQITSSDGRVAPYTGPLVKWSPEALKEGVTFGPRSSRVFVIELSSLYEIGNGRYRIEYSQDGPGKYDPKGRSAYIFDPIAPAYIETRGRSKGTSGALSPSLGVTAASLSTTRCTTTQITDITKAVADATAYSAESKAYLDSKYSTTIARPRYTTWFGPIDASRWGTVATHFTSINKAFNEASINVDCSCKQKKYYAYVYPTQPYKIYVCGVFWTARPTGTDSKAGTLIHEMSHFNVVAGTQDYIYGQTGAQSLATTDPTQAINNADSHEYFAENNPALN